jgi:hypothetical protein
VMVTRMMNDMMTVAVVDRSLGRSDGDRNGEDGDGGEAEQELAHGALNEWWLRPDGRHRKIS